LSEALLDGRIDALISTTVPSALQRGGGHVRRLFPDYKAVEIAYYRATGIVPIMHTVVVKRELCDAHPGLAAELLRVFTEAKDTALERLADTDYLACALLWLPAAVEEQRALLGGDVWPYGIGANRRALEAFARACDLQGLLQRPVTVDELFAPGTLDS